MSLKSHRYRVLGVVGVAAGGLALALSSVASGATPSPAPASSSSNATGAPAGGPPAPGTSGAPTPGKGGPMGDPGRGGPVGGPGRSGPEGGPMGGPGAGGVVTSISSTSLTVRNDFGTSTTYTLNSSTKYQAGPKKTLSRSDIVAGDRVDVRPTTAGGKTAATVDEHAPHLDGVVASVSGSTITITDPEGFTRTIRTSGSTTYTKGGSSASSSSITAGTPVHAEGTIDADRTTLDATSVEVRTAPKAPAAGSAAPAAPSTGSSAAPSTGASATGS